EGLGVVLGVFARLDLLVGVIADADEDDARLATGLGLLGGEDGGEEEGGEDTAEQADGSGPDHGRWVLSIPSAGRDSARCTLVIVCGSRQRCKTEKVTRGAVARQTCMRRSPPARPISPSAR